MVIVLCSIARCIIFRVTRLPVRPCDERPPAMYGHFCLVPRVSVHDRYYCTTLCSAQRQVGNPSSERLCCSGNYHHGRSGSFARRCSTHGCLCWADGQNVQHTAVFVEQMDRMFNAFNSQTLTSCAPMQHGFRDSSQHVLFLAECNEWLSKVTYVGSRKLPCMSNLSGWQK